MTDINISLPETMREFVEQQVVQGGYGSIAAAAQEQIDEWVAIRHRSFRKPTPEQAREIDTTLDAAGSLDPAMCDAIREELNYWLRAG